jgi:hypothetical protein
MKVDLRQFPKLMNEIVPKVSHKFGTLNSRDFTDLLINEYGIPVFISPGAILYWVEMEEETYTWISLKWK